MFSIENMLFILRSREDQMRENLPSDAYRMPDSERRLNKMLLVGAPEWIRGVIHRLHALGFEEAGAWSQLMPTKKPGEMISILAKPRVKD